MNLVSTNLRAARAPAQLPVGQFWHWWLQALETTGGLKQADKKMGLIMGVIYKVI